MKLEDIQIIQTDDGSSSLFVPGLNETYHSRHGARQESMHVFIKNGLQNINGDIHPIRILEVGFGTGLNALLTMQFAQHKQMNIEYVTLETSPLGKEIYSQLNYGKNDEEKQWYEQIHEATWNQRETVIPGFVLFKINKRIQEFTSDNKFHLVYFDAFGPPTQPEMWTKEIFQRITLHLEDGGSLVTYCAKGQVRRDLESCGLRTERLAGPPGKREMLRATLDKKQ